MSRAPPPGGPGRMPTGMANSNRQPPPRGYGNPQAYGHPPRVNGSAPASSNGEKPFTPRVSLQATKVAGRGLSEHFIYGNKSAVSARDFPPKADGSDHYILIRVPAVGQKGEEGQYVVTGRPIRDFEPGRISLSDPQRSWMQASLTDNLTGELFDPFAKGGQAYLGAIDLDVDFASANKKTEKPFEEDDLIARFLTICKHDVLQPKQRILMDVANIPLLITVREVGLTDLSMTSEDTGDTKQKAAHARGILTEQSIVSFHTTGAQGFNLNQSVGKPSSHALLAPDFKFEEMGIGGLDKEFEQIFRRAFVSRIFDTRIAAQMGIKHVKGMLLHGPPGTGKTLIARKIGQMLNAHPPKVVNGPEILNKYVGQSEENIRKLFADAEKEHKEKPNNSGLHIIIFDELDAICKQRGSSSGGTGVGDGVVNQLLTMLDGVHQLPNILVIGMTNRKDLIDTALLRPGRLEVHVEISLPDEAGRLQILKIHTAKSMGNGFLDSDVQLEELADLTKNYSGAELEGLVHAASNHAMMRHIDASQGVKVKSDVQEIKIHRHDFMLAMKDVVPAYGFSELSLQDNIQFGIINYSPAVDSLLEEVSSLFQMMNERSHTTNMSLLLHGIPGSGKSALATHCALKSQFLYVNTIQPSDFAVYRDDTAKKEHAVKVFEDAYKSSTSLLILEDFERLVDWNPNGPRFSLTLLAALTTMIRKQPPKGHRLCVLATTSDYAALQTLGADRDFTKVFGAPIVRDLQELQTILTHLDFSDDLSQAVLARVEAKTSSDRVNVGVRDIIRAVNEALWKARDDEKRTVEAVAHALATEILHRRF